MHCPFCGTDVADGIAVCPSCNATLASQSLKPDTPASESTIGGPTAQEATPPQKPRKSRKGLIGAIIAIVVVFGAVIGLNYIGVLNIPFLPRSPEITLLRTFSGIVGDGEFFVTADADADLDLDLSVAGQNAGVTVDTKLYGDGNVSSFDVKDPLTMKVSDGMFEANGTVALDIGLLGQQKQPVSAYGSYNLDLAEGTLEYSLIEPYSHRDTVKIDVDALRKNLEESDFSFDMNRIQNLKADGNTITFTLKAEEFDSSKLSSEQLEALSKIGVDPNDLKVTTSDYDVTVTNHEDEHKVDVNVVGNATISMTGNLEAVGAGAQSASLDGSMDMNTTITLRDRNR